MQLADAWMRILRPLGCRTGLASGMLGGPNLRRRTQFKLVSGPAWPDDAGCLRELGADDHSFKPFRRDRVPAMLSRHARPHAPAESQDSAAPAHAGAAGRAPGEAPPVLDPGALARLAELDPKGENRLLERVLRAFQSSVARLRPQLDAGRRDGDQGAIRLVAHTLKSSSASIGALQLSQWCAQVEAAARLEARADLSGPLDSLDAALDAALQAIDGLLKERE